jgi:hypothetical protein
MSDPIPPAMIYRVRLTQKGHEVLPKLSLHPRVLAERAFSAIGGMLASAGYEAVQFRERPGDPRRRIVVYAAKDRGHPKWGEILRLTPEAP